MPRIILLLAIAVVVYLLYRRAQSAPPHKRRSEYIKLALGIAVVAVIVLTLAGRMHWLGAAITGLLVALRQMLPTLVRLFPMLASLRGNTGPSQGQTSTVTTEILRMHLDHDSGKLSGEVLKGHYREWLLDEMNRDQLDELLAYCQHEDAESVQLLDSYLQQRFAADGGFHRRREQPEHDQNMSRKEALEVLGLQEGATEEEVIAAHRRLMQKLHPDRGGNDYLAAKVNQAKDLLLG